MRENSYLICGATINSLLFIFFSVQRQKDLCTSQLRVLKYNGTHLLHVFTEVVFYYA